MEKLFMQFIGKSEEELAAIIDTGFFNSIIEGYLVATLKGIEQDQKTIDEARVELRALFENMTALEAKKVVER